MDAGHSRNLSIVIAALIIAATVAGGMWYQNHNSPYERCVRATVAMDAPSVGVTKAEGFAVYRCRTLSR